jgi:hypothetical protein
VATVRVKKMRQNLNLKQYPFEIGLLCCLQADEATSRLRQARWPRDGLDQSGYVENNAADAGRSAGSIEEERAVSPLPGSFGASAQGCFKEKMHDRRHHGG